MDKKHLLAIFILIPLFIPILGIRQAHAQSTYPPVSVTASPNPISFSVGSSATAQINITSLNGFSGPVTLRATAYPYQQLNVTLTPSSVSVPTAGTATSTAKVSGNSTTTPATYNIYIYANTGTYQILGILNATVTPAPTSTPDFRLSASLTSIPISPGASTQVRISAASLAGFAGDINLTSSFGTATFNTTTLHLGAGRIANATLTLIGYCPYFNSLGQGTFEVDAHSGARFHWLPLQYFFQTLPPSFCISTSTFQKILIGTSGSNFVSVGTIGGFKGNVILTTKSPFQTAFFPNDNISTPQSPNAQTSFAITVPSNMVPGNYTLTLTGTSGSQTYNVNETIEATTGTSYFTMALSPASLTIPHGSTRNLIVALTGQSGFARTVDLFFVFSNNNFQFTSYPPLTDFSVQSGIPTLIVLTIDPTTLPPGDYSLWMTAQSAYMPYVEQIQVVPIIVQAAPLANPDVSIKANLSTITLPQGATSTATVSVAGLNGYVGTAQLFCGPTIPWDLNCWLANPGTTILLDAQSRNITLNIATNAYANPGTYGLVVSIEAFTPGVQGSNMTRAIDIAVMITSPTILGVTPAIFYSIVVGVAGVGAIAATTAFFLLRWRRPLKNP